LISQAGLGASFHEYLASAGSDQKQNTTMSGADAAARLEDEKSATGGTQTLDLAPDCRAAYVRLWPKAACHFADFSEV